MKKLNLNSGMNKLETFCKSVLAFGRKNSTSLLTGGSIALGWVGVYIFWNESKKAEKAIAAKESELNKDKESLEEKETLPIKEKLIIYLQYCWLSALFGAGSTFLALYSQKLNLEEIYKYAILTQLYKGKNENLEAEVTKEKNGDKKLKEYKENIYKEKYPPDEIIKDIDSIPGEGRTLFVDTLTGFKWKDDITEMIMRITEYNVDLRDMWTRRIRNKLGDAFYVSDTPYPDDLDIYVSEDLTEFLEKIGELKYNSNTKIGELLEFRYYGGGDLLKPKQILLYEKYKDPDGGAPVFCYVDYADLLSPTPELIERNPL